MQQYAYVLVSIIYTLTDTTQDRHVNIAMRLQCNLRTNQKDVSDLIYHKNTFTILNTNSFVASKSGVITNNRYNKYRFNECFS